MDANPTVNLISTQVTLSAISVAFIQWLKSRSWFPILHGTSDWANRAASGLMSIATAIGIHITWTHGDVPGAYMIAVSGLTVTGLATGAFAVIKSMVFNELIYRSTVKSQQPGKPGQVLGAPVEVPAAKP